MKLLVAIIQPADADEVGEQLRAAGHRFTRLASTGGFLEAPNVTLILAVEDDAAARRRLPLRESCSARDRGAPRPTEQLADWQERVVHYAGATILVLDLAELIRL